jgi:hypothetical protein
MVERGDSVFESQRSLRALTLLSVVRVFLAALLERYVFLFRAAWNINNAVKKVIYWSSTCGNLNRLAEDVASALSANHGTCPAPPGLQA